MRQEFIMPHCPHQSEMVERVVRTISEQRAHRHRFETLHLLSRVIRDWIVSDNHRRPYQALRMKIPAEASALAT